MIQSDAGGLLRHVQDHAVERDQYRLGNIAQNNNTFNSPETSRFETNNLQRNIYGPSPRP